MQNIIYVVVGLIIIGSIGWFAFGKNMQTADAPTDEAQTASQRTSMKALLALTSPQKCTFTDSTEAGNTSGTVYIKSGKMRGDFNAETSAGAMTSHMIVLDNTSYVWTDETSEGFKISLDQTTETETSASNNTEAVDMDKEVDYSCENWSGDESVFSLPSNITFTDMSEMMKGLNIDINAQMNAGAGAQGSADQCTACAQVPEAYRAQCLTSLGCS
jgi:hypothetical protein